MPLLYMYKIILFIYFVSALRYYGTGHRGRPDYVLFIWLQAPLAEACTAISTISSQSLTVLANSACCIKRLVCI